MKNSNMPPWLIGLGMGLGSWLVQQDPQMNWAKIVMPANVGSLILVIVGVFVTGKFVKN